MTHSVIRLSLVQEGFCPIFAMSIADVIIDVIVIICINEMPAEKAVKFTRWKTAPRAPLIRPGYYYQLYIYPVHCCRYLFVRTVRQKASLSVSALFLLAFNVIAARTEHSLSLAWIIDEVFSFDALLHLSVFQMLLQNL